ncbi:MAG: 30S ribosome-binding factor RbfA [Gammaproteobacteria bacterium]|nr:30S ribosome-binding factor RbfA [Gammaproteobacteria bacterium]
MLGEALAGHVRDPRLAGVTVTGVSVSRDLSVARVYVALLSGDAFPEATLAALRSAAGFLRSTLARDLQIRMTPELRFFPDEALARSRALESLIEMAVRTDDQKHAGSAAGDEDDAGPAPDRSGPRT